MIRTGYELYAYQPLPADMLRQLHEDERGLLCWCDAGPAAHGMPVVTGPSYPGLVCLCKDPVSNHDEHGCARVNCLCLTPPDVIAWYLSLERSAA